MKRNILETKDYTPAFSFMRGLRPVLIDPIDLPTEDLADQYPGVRRFGDSIFFETHITSLNGGVPLGKCLRAPGSGENVDRCP